MSGVKDKMLVGERFRRALCSYPESAVVQEAMARELVSMVRLHAGEERLGRVLEIGAGSGLLTELLLEAFPVASLTANDLVGECREPLREIARRLRIAEFSFLKGDIEECGELPGSQDLVVSNATLQWLNDLDKLFAAVRRSLVPGKLFAFTSFTVGNMEEIAMLGGGGLSYRTTEEIGEIAGRHFELLELKESREQLTFPRLVRCLAIFARPESTVLAGSGGAEAVIWTLWRTTAACFGYREGSALPIARSTAC